MEWRDEGIVLSTRAFGETSVILDVLTKAHGRASGLVRGGRSRRLRPGLQPGNSLDVTWRARLDDQLGNFAVEVAQSRAGRLMETATGTFGIQAAAGLLRLLPDRDPHPRLYEALGLMLDHLDEPRAAGAIMVRFELAFLEEVGFGLDLASCAATGVTADLVWVSPRTGRAVSREAGAPYADRLLTLPGFLSGGESATPASPVELRAAFDLTGYFLEVCLLGPADKTLPAARQHFVSAVARGLGANH
ncbi:DNA repair protein RecO [Amorphus sp. 3PC139-8]|uniref:DNA repair protein RecO n=1 Tax=Amorphus sp. 3PC139-8 TaxID=2735676 RepID=UPI00345DAA91